MQCSLHRARLPHYSSAAELHAPSPHPAARRGPQPTGPPVLSPRAARLPLLPFSMPWGQQLSWLSVRSYPLCRNLRWATLPALILQLVVDHSPPGPQCSPHGQLGSLSSPSACPGDSSSAGCQCVPTHCAGTCAGPRCRHPALPGPPCHRAGWEPRSVATGEKKKGKETGAQIWLCFAFFSSPGNFHKTFLFLPSQFKQRFCCGSTVLVLRQVFILCPSF